MAKDTIYNILKIVLIVLIFAVLVLIFTVQPKETFTELYFENPDNLPEGLNPGESGDFSFSIHNLEDNELEYSYTIYIEYYEENELVSSDTLEQDSIILSTGQTATFSKSFSISEFEKAKVIVESSGQEIYFWTM
tara:strand:- start:1035 stop:1439 length:405 start_codon:yes stop_codon:yes gene_type:complete